MIRFVLVLVLMLAGMAYGLYSLFESQQQTIAGHVSDNAGLVLANEDLQASVESYQAQIEIERDLSSKSAADSKARESELTKKLQSAKGNHDEKWYSNTLPSAAECLLGKQGMQTGDKVCADRSAPGVLETDSGTALVPNQTHLIYTLELEGALDDCNADKAIALEYVERTHAAIAR